MDTLDIQRRENYAVIIMQNGKVNAINPALSRDLKEAFLSLEADDDIKGVILAGRPHCFSAGLDVSSMANPGEDGGRSFWVNYIDALKAMIQFSKPFVCAITGYAPAGATIFAICADYRVMGRGDKHVIGMNEFKMSLQIPEMMGDIFAYQMGEKEAWKAVQAARLYNSDEALEVGLVDESVEVEEVMGRAEQHLKKLMKVHPPVFKKSKRYFRKGLLKIAEKPTEGTVKVILDEWKDPFVQKTLQQFLINLKK